MITPDLGSGPTHPSPTRPPEPPRPHRDPAPPPPKPTPGQPKNAVCRACRRRVVQLVTGWRHLEWIGPCEHLSLEATS